MKGKRGRKAKRVWIVAGAACALVLVGVGKDLETHPEVRAAWRKGYPNGELPQGSASAGTERERR